MTSVMQLTIYSGVVSITSGGIHVTTKVIIWGFPIYDYSQSVVVAGWVSVPSVSYSITSYILRC